MEKGIGDYGKRKKGAKNNASAGGRERVPMLQVARHVRQDVGLQCGKFILNSGPVLKLSQAQSVISLVSLFSCSRQAERGYP